MIHDSPTPAASPPNASHGAGESETASAPDRSADDTQNRRRERQRAAGRERSEPILVVIYWRDIPAQVNAQLGRVRHPVLLPAKFQRAIDRARRKAKIVTAQDEVAQWHRVSRPCSDDLPAEASREAKRLSADYPVERLGRLAFVGGLEEALDPPAATSPATVDG